VKDFFGPICATHRGYANKRQFNNPQNIQFNNPPIKLQRPVRKRMDKKMDNNMFNNKNNYSRKRKRAEDDMFNNMDDENYRSRKRFCKSKSDSFCELVSSSIGTCKKYFCYAHNSNPSICNIYGCVGVTKERYEKFKNYKYSYFL